MIEKAFMGNSLYYYIINKEFLNRPGDKRMISLNLKKRVRQTYQNLDFEESKKAHDRVFLSLQNTQLSTIKV